MRAQMILLELRSRFYDQQSEFLSLYSSGHVKDDQLQVNPIAHA